MRNHSNKEFAITVQGMAGMRNHGNKECAMCIYYSSMMRTWKYEQENRVFAQDLPFDSIFLPPSLKEKSSSESFKSSQNALLGARRLADSIVRELRM